MKDCKYRPPCNWCDKYDRMCEAVLLDIYKEEQKKNTEPKECEHKWIERIEKTDLHNGHGESYYIQRKYCVECGVAEERMYTLTELSYLENT